MVKSFDAIEKEIADKGFKTLLKEASEEVQNITRTLSYLEEHAADDDTKKLVDALTGRLVACGVELLGMATSIPDGC